MGCKLDGASEAKQNAIDMVSDDPRALQELGDFLLALQENPLPRGRKNQKKQMYSMRLRCGIFVTWELRGDPTLLLTGDPGGKLVVKILGVDRTGPVGDD